MARRISELLTLCAAATASLMLVATAQAVDLRDWGSKLAAGERFVVLAAFDNEAVLDKQTQLVWQRTVANAVVNHEYAADGCARTPLGGRRGWRLPSVHELASLADPLATMGSLALPTGHPFTSWPGYPIIKGPYWTATRVHNSSTYGYVVDFGNSGWVNAKLLKDLAVVLCVRGGGPISEY